MAEIDLGLVFADSQAVTATTLATKSIPLSKIRNIFQGEPMAIVINIIVAADATDGNETYQWDVLSDDNAAMSSPATILSRAIARGLLLINTQWTILPPLESTMEAFLGLQATLGGTTPSVTYTAYLSAVKDIPQVKVYADALTIS